MLVSIGGLPVTGKTTVARSLAGQLGAAYVRIDTIETAIGRAEGRFQQTNDWELAPGYEVGYDVAVDQLRNGVDVVAESVNPLRGSRDAWRDAGLRAGARVVEVEIVCTDVTEHRRRAEERVLDVVGLTKPSWEQITNREYDSWDRDHSSWTVPSLASATLYDCCMRRSEPEVRPGRLGHATKVAKGSPSGTSRPGTSAGSEVRCLDLRCPHD